MPRIDLNKELNPVARPKLGHLETILVNSRVVACDGGDGVLGHPKVWLRIVDHQAYCPYCSREFVTHPEAKITSTTGEH
ncbi:zinc-finger domain-containing protein [Entomobacter blattae]|uniref:Zinc-finger domain protein n=1 Tax=Entomobacter blattae TaxID=2762277 RepID=A0A7H1NNU6_9PROT|nr:zinc-finger domain-containing protein [Entomobacter blattae]QNT77456.1 Zinc-finger domain protein [Entomobacter blattae]